MQSLGKLPMREPLSNCSSARLNVCRGNCYTGASMLRPALNRCRLRPRSTPSVTESQPARDTGKPVLCLAPHRGQSGLGRGARAASSPTSVPRFALGIRHLAAASQSAVCDIGQLRPPSKQQKREWQIHCRPAAGRSSGQSGAKTTMMGKSEMGDTSTHRPAGQSELAQSRDTSQSAKLTVSKSKSASRTLQSPSLILQTPALAMALVLPLSLAYQIPPFGALLYPELGNWFTGTVALFYVLGGWGAHMQERSGVNMKYSKFASEAPKGLPQVSSKLGMFLFYFPAAALASAYLYTAVTGFDLEGSLGLPLAIGLNGGEASLRFTIMTGLMTAHFMKRTLETLFLHKYSGSMDLATLGTVPTSYFVLTLSTLWLQKLVEGVPAPSIDLMWLGVALSLVGLAGNLYHHYLLSTLRSSMDSQGVKRYSIPRGGLFEYVACGHYFFEILSFVGYACVSQTVMGVGGAAFAAFYLSARSQSTLEWYQDKIEDFPKDRKALIPFLY